MRYVSMQVLTWGTVAGAVASALWLAAYDSQPNGSFGAAPIGAAIELPTEPTKAGRRQRQGGKAADGTARGASGADAPAPPASPTR